MSSSRTRRSAASAATAAITASSPLREEYHAPTPTKRRALTRRQVSYAEVPAGVDDPGSSEEEIPDVIEDGEGDGEGEGEEEEGGDEGVDEDVTMDIAEDEEEQDEEDQGEENATPTTKRIVRTTRGKGRRGNRGKGKGRPRVVRQPSRTETNDEEEGNADTPKEEVEVVQSIRNHRVRGVDYEVIDDEVAMEDDEKGEDKVDDNGKLLGGREYKVATFTCPDRANSTKLYMLGIDVARAAGHTDSSLVARKFHFLVKAYLTEQEKLMVLELGHGGGSNFHNGRPVTIYAARNIYKYMGAKIIKNGRWVTDDYYEDAAVEKCEAEGIEAGSLAPSVRREDVVERSTVNSAREQDRLIGAPFYTPGGPTTTWGSHGTDPWTDAGHGNKRSRLMSYGINSDNWMWRMAISAREWEAGMTRDRKERFMDLSREKKMWVWEEQYGDAPGPSNSKDKWIIEGEDQKDKMEVSPEPFTYKVPTSASIDTLYEQDEAFRQRLLDLGSSDAMPNLDAFSSGKTDIGRIVVETPKETLKRKREIVKRVKPGQPYGLYEPHTNQAHVPLYLQPTRSGVSQVDTLPHITTTRGTGSRWTWPPSVIHTGIISRRTVGTNSKGIMSVEYVFENETSREEDEIAKRERVVQDAIEWEQGRT